MKIKAGNFKVNIKTLIDVRKDGKLPRLYVHEKFEKPLKWIVRTIAIVSFITTFLALDSYVLSVSIGLGLFLLSFIFDRAIVKYTTFIVQPFPDFEIDYSQWYNIMTVSQPDHKKHVNVVGFVYKDIEYGKKFFKYIKSWNFDNSVDKDRNIILSIVEEPNGAFTFYIYASPYRKNLDKMLKAVAVENFIEKRKDGKFQEGLVMQMAYWHTTKYTDDKHMRDFLKYQPTDEKFMFVPSAKYQNSYRIDIDSQIILHGYKYAKRQDLHKYSTENQLTEMAKKWKD
ncbi:hypothetical protein [Hymenobacter terrenus]|uniref:hypothetical protein n=1 Tax=Hymenobacter terrenus TaxID=1629124 RepID=UPI0012E01F44|nr:hypothetical protein [Hymenobacter terrenus]